MCDHIVHVCGANLYPTCVFVFSLALRLFLKKNRLVSFSFFCFHGRRPGSSEMPRNPLTRWDVSSIPANGIFLTKKLKNKNKNAQRVEND